MDRPARSAPSSRRSRPVIQSRYQGAQVRARLAARATRLAVAGGRPVVIRGIGLAVWRLADGASRREVARRVQVRQRVVADPKFAIDRLDLVQPFMDVALLRIGIGCEGRPVVGRDRAETGPEGGLGRPDRAAPAAERHVRGRRPEHEHRVVSMATDMVEQFLAAVARPGPPSPLAARREARQRPAHLHDVERFECHQAIAPGIGPSRAGARGRQSRPPAPDESSPVAGAADPVPSHTWHS